MTDHVVLADSPRPADSAALPFLRSQKILLLLFQPCRDEDKITLAHQWAAATQRLRHRTMKPIAVNTTALQTEVTMDIALTETDVNLTITAGTTIAPLRATPTPTASGLSGARPRRRPEIGHVNAAAAGPHRSVHLASERQLFLLDGHRLIPITTLASITDSTCQDRYHLTRGRGKMVSLAKIRSM